MTTANVPPPGRHGGDGARLAAALGIPLEEVLDLSLSLNPCAPDAAALVAKHATAAGRYPDARPPTAALAAAMAVDPERLVLTNGGAEAIALVAAEHPIGQVQAPDFSLYERHLAQLDPTGLRWRSNPNNPTGRLAPPDARAEVWDEAFYPLATGRWSRGDADAVVVGSLTKLFACPGVRLGYVVAPTADAARRLAARQPEWSVSSIACAIVPDLLATADLPAWAEAIAARRARLDAMLRDAGFVPDPSDANFVLVRDAAGLRERLARRGVLVRDTGSFGIGAGVRIAVPDHSDLDRLHAALREE